MIKTSVGEKTPTEALKLFMRAKLRTGDLMGILTQLRPYKEGVAAVEHVLADPDKYGKRIVEQAQEESARRPIGAQSIENPSDLSGLLEKCGVCSRVEITIKRTCSYAVEHVLNLRTLQTEGDPSAFRDLAESAEWWDAPRTLRANLVLASPGAIRETSTALFGFIEKFQIIATFDERLWAWQQSAPLSKKVLLMLQENPFLCYDQELFLYTCREENFLDQADQVDLLYSRSSVEEMLLLFPRNSLREKFLESYAAHFQAMVLS